MYIDGKLDGKCYIIYNIHGSVMAMVQSSWVSFSEGGESDPAVFCRMVVFGLPDVGHSERRCAGRAVAGPVWCGASSEVRAVSRRGAWKLGQETLSRVRVESGKNFKLATDTGKMIKIVETFIWKKCGITQFSDQPTYIITWICLANKTIQNTHYIYIYNPGSYKHGTSGISL